MEDQIWNKDNHELRTRRKQRFRARHPQRNVSLGKRRNNDIAERRGALMKRHETVSGVAGKDRYGIGENDGNVEEPNDRSQAMDAMRSWADDKTNGKETEAGSYLSPPISPHTSRSSAIRERLTREQKRRANTVDSRISVPTPPAHRSWTDHGSSPKVKDGPDHDSDFQPSESEHSESSHNEGFDEPSLPGDGDNRQGPIDQMKLQVEGDYPRKVQQKERANDYELRLELTNSGHALFDDDQVRRRDFGVWNPSDEQKSDHVLLQKAPRIDQNIDETDNGLKEAVSDKSKKLDEMGTLSETHDLYKYEHHSVDVQPQPSKSMPTVVDIIPIHDLVEEPFDSESNRIKEEPETPHLPDRMENINRYPQPIYSNSDHLESPNLQSSSPTMDQNKNPDTTQSPDTTRFHGNESFKVQPKPPSHDETKSLDPQSVSPGSDPIKSLDMKSESADSGGITVTTMPIQDQVRKDDDLEARLTGEPLRGNDRASLSDSQRSASIRPHPSKDPGSDKDSLILSPARSDELGYSEEEDWDRIANANDEIIKIIDQHKANSQLEPTSEEQEARYWRKAKKAADKTNRSQPGIDSKCSSISTPSSDASFLLSPGQDNEESQTNAEPGLDNIEQVEEEGEEEFEGANQAVMDMIELRRANYELQKDIEAKEAKFKLEIKAAWNRPRPPPTTREQVRDRQALENIKSKEVFDELGDQQRPIKTDSNLVVRETQIEIMITRARTCYMLEDYRRMYTRANEAVEAASPLEYPPLTARCCYHRGLASYHHGDFGSARDDFVEARGCAGLYGISKESIERYIHLIDSGIDAETAMLEQLSTRTVSRGRPSRRTRRTRRDESSPSSAEVTTLCEDLSPNEEENSTGQPHETVDSQPRISRRPNHPPTLSLPNDDHQPPSADTIPTYQPQDEAISEAIRKDILESRVQSLNPAAATNNNNNTASPLNAKSTTQQQKEKQNLAPPSLAITEQTTHGTATLTTTSPGPGSGPDPDPGPRTTTTTRHVPRPHIAPITTSFSPPTTPNPHPSDSNSHSANMNDDVHAHVNNNNNNDDDDDAHERSPKSMDSDEIYAAFGGRLEEGETPDSTFTPVEERDGWGR